MIYELLLSCESGFITAKSTSRTSMPTISSRHLPGNALFSVSKHVFQEASQALALFNTGGVRPTDKMRWYRKQKFIIENGHKITLQRLRKLDLDIRVECRQIDYNSSEACGLGNCMRRIIDLLRQNSFANQKDHRLQLTITFHEQWNRERYEPARDEAGLFIGRILRTTPFEDLFATQYAADNTRTRPIRSKQALETWFKLVQLRELMGHFRKDLLRQVTNVDLKSNAEDQPVPDGLSLYFVSPKKMRFCDNKDTSMGLVELVPWSTNPAAYESTPEGLHYSVTWRNYNTSLEADAKQERANYYETVNMGKERKKLEQATKRKDAKAKKQAAKVETTAEYGDEQDDMSEHRL